MPAVSGYEYKWIYHQRIDFEIASKQLRAVDSGIGFPDLCLPLLAIVLLVGVWLSLERPRSDLSTSPRRSPYIQDTLAGF